MSLKLVLYVLPGYQGACEDKEMHVRRGSPELLKGQITARKKSCRREVRNPDSDKE